MPRPAIIPGMSEPPVPCHGRCLCGAVRFTADAAPKWIAHCHCESCRRSTGAPMTTYVGFHSESFAFTEGQPAVHQSSPGVFRSFCGRCGSPLTYHADRWPGEVHVHISSLDQPERFEPRFHVYYEESLPWLHLDDGLKRHATSAGQTPALKATRGP